MVTGSSATSETALVRVLGTEGHDVVALDAIASPFTTAVVNGHRPFLRADEACRAPTPSRTR